MKKSTVLFGTGEQVVDQTRNPSLIEKRINQNNKNVKKVNNKRGNRVTLPKNQTNNFSK